MDNEKMYYLEFTAGSLSSLANLRDRISYSKDEDNYRGLAGQLEHFEFDSKEEYQDFNKDKGYVVVKDMGDYFLELTDEEIKTYLDTLS